MLASWKESYDKTRQHIKKQRHHFTDKSPYSQGYGFASSHVQMRELDRKQSWALPRIDAFELWCWRRLLRIPWTARRSNQSFLKEINPEYSLEGIDAKAEALILWPPDAKRPWCWERLKAGKGRGNRGQNDWMASSNQWTWVWANSRTQWRTGMPPGMLQSMGSQKVRPDLATEQ